MGKKDKIFVLPNADKDEWQEKEDNKNIANFRRGFKMLIAGRPSCGKTNLIKSLIIHQEPPFDDIYICHIDPSSQEYEDCDGKMMNIDGLPNPEDITPEQKLLVILEDCDFDSYTRAQKEKINTYLRYICSHKGLSLIISCQDPFCIPSTYRKKIDIFILFRFDPITLTMLSKKVEMTKEEMKHYFDHHIKSKHDNICIDLSGSGNLIRKNLFQVLKRI